MEWIDFTEVRERVRLEDVLLGMYALGDKLRRSGGRLVGACPIHRGDGVRAFSADLEKNIWYCHSGCRRGGNVIDLVVAMDGIPVREAALKLRAAFLSDAAPPKAPPRPRAAASKEAAAEAEGEEAPAPARDADANPPISLRLAVAHDHPHLIGTRGLPLETLQSFGVGYCARGLHRGSIAIPIRDGQGRLVAYAGRRLKHSEVQSHGKYRFPKGFRKELVLYNLDRARESAASGRGLVVVEGFFSVLRLHALGFPNAVAVMGASLSEAQARLVAALGAPATLLFDGDDAGRGGAEAARAALEGKVPVRGVRLPDGLSPDDAPAGALRWALGGAERLDLAEVAFRFRAATEDPAPSGQEASP